MPRIFEEQIVVIQGGGGGTGVVTWGPNFGTPGGDSLPQIQSISMPAVGLSMDLPQIQSIRNPNIGLSTGVAQIQAIAMSLGLLSDLPHRQTIAMPNVGLSTAISQPQAIANPAIGLSSDLAQTHTLGAKILSAPFWQSVATKALATVLGATTIVVNKPTGLAVGDLMVAWICASVTPTPPTISPPSGWTTDDTDAQGETRGAVFYKVADSADVAASNFTFTFSISSLRATGEIHRVIGQHATTPLNVSVIARASVIDPIVPAVTTTEINCLVFVFLAHVHAIAQTHAPPASHVERAEFADTNTTQLGSSSYTRLFASAADTGTATVDCNELAASAAIYARVAIAPAEIVL